MTSITIKTSENKTIKDRNVKINKTLALKEIRNALSGITKYTF